MDGLWAVSWLGDLESNGDLAPYGWGTSSLPGWVRATRIFPALLGAAGADAPGYRSWHHVALSVPVSAAPCFFTAAQITGTQLRFALTL